MLTTSKLTFRDVRTEPLNWNVLIKCLVSRGIDLGLVQQGERTKAPAAARELQPTGRDAPQPFHAELVQPLTGREIFSCGPYSASFSRSRLSSASRCASSCLERRLGVKPEHQPLKHPLLPAR